MGPTSRLQRATDPQSASFRTPCSEPTPDCLLCLPAHRPLSPAGVSLGPGPGPPQARSRFTLSSTSTLAHLGAPRRASLQPRDQVGFPRRCKRSRRRQAHSRAALAAGDWLIQLCVTQPCTLASWLPQPGSSRVPHLCSQALAWWSRPHCPSAQGGKRGWKHPVSSERSDSAA